MEADIINLRPKAALVTSFDRHSSSQSAVEEQAMDLDSEYIFDCVHNCDESSLAVSLSNNIIKLYALPLLEVSGQFNAHESTITHMKYSSTDPNILFSCSLDGTVRGWDIRTYSDAVTLTLAQEVLDMDLPSADAGSNGGGAAAHLLAVAVEGRGACLFDVRRLAPQHALAPALLADGHSDTVTQVCFSPPTTVGGAPGGGGGAASSSTLLATGGEDNLGCIYDAGRIASNVSGKNPDDALLSVLNMESTVQRMGFFGTGADMGLWCLTCTETVSVWHAAAARRLVDLQNPLGMARDRGAALDYLLGCYYFPSFDGLQVVGGTHTGEGWVMRLAPPSPFSHEAQLVPYWKLSGGHQADIRCSDLLSANQPGHEGFLITGGEDARLCVWDLGQPQQSSAEGISQSMATDSSAGRNDLGFGPVRNTGSRQHRTAPY